MSWIYAKSAIYVLSTINGVVEEVYEVDDWYKSEKRGRVEFHGHVAPDHIRDQCIHKKLPRYYRKKGMASPALYKKNGLMALNMRNR